MPLPMARPMRRKSSKNHQFRRRVPAQFRESARGERFSVVFPPGGAEPGFTAEAVLGDEVNFSLRTTSPALAKRRQALASEALDRFLKGLSTSPEPLTQREREAIAGQAYRQLIEEYGEDPGVYGFAKAAGWAELEGRLEDGLRHFNVEGDGIEEPAYSPKFGARLLEPEIRLDSLLASLGISRLADGDRIGLIESVARAQLEACRVLLRRTRGDFGKDPAADRFPTFAPRIAKATPEQSPKTAPRPVDLDTIFAPWAREHEEAGGVPETRKAWRMVLERFAASCPDTSPSQWTREDVANWVTKRLAEVRRATIDKQDLPALQNIFDVAKSAGLLSRNPVKDYREGRKKRGAARAGGVDSIEMEGFTDGEAAALLEAARQQGLPYRRWVPWLCALSGSRVSPIMNLRYQDIREVDGVLCFDVTKAAGPIKTGESERTVPLHAELVAQGFLEFVETRKGKRLFFEEGRLRGERRNPGKSRLNHLRDWVHEVAREKGLKIGREHRKDPNHAWRHWFKRTAADAGVPDRVSDAITGHAPANEGAGYSKVTIKQMVEAMERLAVSPFQPGEK